MSDPFIAEIRLFAGNYAPKGWAFCHGQILPIGQNTTLFSLLGTTYGGDGTSTFALPDLRGRAPLHAGSGPGLTPRTLGVPGGAATSTLKPTHLPKHAHKASSAPATTSDPTGAVPAGGGNYTPTSAKFSPGQPHNNMPPYLGLSFIIALQGVYPPRS